MVVDERARQRLFRTLEERLGPDEAATLMSLLPPVGWADVATKHDVDSLRAATKHDLESLGTATKHELDQLRREMDLRFDAVEKGLRAELHSSLEKHTRAVVIAVSTLNLALAGMAFAAARLV